MDNWSRCFFLWLEKSVEYVNNPKAILNLTLALLEVRSNLKKYQTMNIGHGQSDNNTTQVIRLNSHDISITDSLKLLGVTI